MFPSSMGGVSPLLGLQARHVQRDGTPPDRLHTFEDTSLGSSKSNKARRFLLRGIVNVSAEWVLLATSFNLRTLWRIWRDWGRPRWSQGWAQAAMAGPLGGGPTTAQPTRSPNPRRLQDRLAVKTSLRL